MFGIFIVCTDVDACDCTEGLSSRTCFSNVICLVNIRVVMIIISKDLSVHVLKIFLLRVSFILYLLFNVTDT